MIRRTVLLPGAVGLLVACALAPTKSARAFPPAKPYDPRPLLAETEKNLTVDKYSFIVMGDTKNSPHFPHVVKLAASLSPQFVLLTGDMVKTGHPKLYDHIEHQLGPFMRKIPTWPCVGNHELGRAEGWQLYKQFYGIRSWDYTFDFRNARFIELGTPGAIHGDERKLKWLEEQLIEGHKAGKLLFIWQHHPVYTVGQKRPREVPGKPNAFTRLCTKYGVVAHIAGHEHIYYRTFRDGVSYIIQALGGARIYYLNRQNEAVNGDVFYGALGKDRHGTLLHTPTREKVYPKPQWMLTQIQVDGRKVTGKTIAVSGQVVDEFVLLPRPTTRPADPAAKRPITKASLKPPLKPGVSGPHKTDWLHKAKWGVMYHVQGDRAPGKWDKVIDGFDVKGVARQLREVGAGYCMLTSIHADYPIAPNAAYEKRYPGQCPKRDLIMDLADELAKYDTPLLLYYNSNIKWEPTQKGVVFRAAVLREFSRRYGPKVKGWWFDNTLPKLDRPQVLAFHKLIADAARAGNPDALLAFSPPHGPQRNSPFDDFTAGNLHKLDKVTCPGRFVDGAQWHTLCYLGTTWGSRRPRYQGNEAATITKRLTDAGGVLTWDTPHEVNGLLVKTVIPQLKAIGQATGTMRKGAR